jgi:hypothetical protein
MSRGRRKGSRRAVPAEFSARLSLVPSPFLGETGPPDTACRADVVHRRMFPPVPHGVARIVEGLATRISVVVPSVAAASG